MIKFLDGPAAGELLQLKRAPLYLRVVIDSRSNAVDALDQLHDEPRASEAIYAYRRDGRPFRYHLKGTRGVSGFYVGGEYRLVANQPGDDVLRDTSAWRAWALAQPAD